MSSQQCTSSFPPTPRRSFLWEQSVPLVSRQAEESEENVWGDDELYSRYSTHISFPVLRNLFATAPAANNSSVRKTNVRQLWVGPSSVLPVHFIGCFCSDFVGKCIGEEAKYEGVRLLFDGLQQPVLNKQVHTQSHTNPGGLWSTDVLLLILLRFWKYQKKSFFLHHFFAVLNILPVFLLTCTIFNYSIWKFLPPPAWKQRHSRNSFVPFGLYYSHWRGTMGGVPQVSILAPLLFNVYLSPLAQITEYWSSVTV